LCRTYAAERVLEVGCGTANHLRAICTSVGCQGWGIDPSSEMLGCANTMGDLSLRLVQGRAEALPFAGEGFDVIFSVDVVHHVTNLWAAFAEVARALRRGGLSVTATDSEATIRSREALSGYFPETIPVELARYPSVEHLERCHAAHGLEVVASFVAEHPYTLTDTQPLRDRAYSCLNLISDAALAAGLARLELALPLECVSRNYVIVARK
jgi:ubiquinone/menaquinone biosynthesis C-methylase UbiE